MAEGAVRVTGLKELTRAFDKFDRDLVKDLGHEVEEAAAPVRVETEKYITQGGGGYGAMRGVVGRSAYVKDMRVGFSRPATAYVAPLWRSNKGTPQGAKLAAAIKRRMEAAVDDQSEQVEKRLGDFLDRLADDWGSHLT